MFLGWFSRGGDEAILNELSMRADYNVQGSISPALNDSAIILGKWSPIHWRVSILTVRFLRAKVKVRVQSQFAFQCSWLSFSVRGCLRISTVPVRLTPFRTPFARPSS